MLSKWIKVNWVDFLWINFKIKLYHYRIRHLHSHNQIKGSFMLNYPRLFPVVMCGCESWTIKRGWAPNNWCFWTVVLQKTLESALNSKKIQPVHRKGDQSWVFIGRTDVEAETPILWPPDPKSWLVWKDPDAGKVWGQEEKGTTENGMVGWHHRLNGHGFGWTPGVGDGQGGLACCSPWGCKEWDMTEGLNWIKFKSIQEIRERYGSWR